MNPQSKKLLSISIRYLIVLVLGLGNLHLFYKVLTPLTTKTTAFILNLFSQTTTIANVILFRGMTIHIIQSCVAGAAYYLLLILILSTPSINFLKRIYIILFSFVSLFILNVARIIFLATIVDSAYFAQAHFFFWYIISTVFVVAIWFSAVKIYKIKSIPIYSDIKYVVSLIKPVKKTKRRK